MTPAEYLRLAVATKSGAESFPTDLPIDVVHAAIGLSTEAGEILDPIKKAVFYGKPLDLDNLDEEMGDMLWYIAIYLNARGKSFEQVMEQNIAKLKARYPGKFTSEAALFRDLPAEQKAMAGANLSAERQTTKILWGIFLPRLLSWARVSGHQFYWEDRAAATEFESRQEAEGVMDRLFPPGCGEDPVVRAFPVAVRRGWGIKNEHGQWLRGEILRHFSVRDGHSKPVLVNVAWTSDEVGALTFPSSGQANQFLFKHLVPRIGICGLTNVVEISPETMAAHEKAQA